MADTGATYPRLGSNEDRAGLAAWSNPIAIQAVGGNAGWSGTDTYSDWLRGSDFGFSVPVDATILGVKLDMERLEVSGVITNSLLYLVDGDGNNTGDSKHRTHQAWVGAEEVSYGGAADLWGATLTPAIVNSANFGARMSVGCSGASQAAVYWYKITVYYTEPPTTTILPATLITSASARINAEVLNDGGASCEGRFSWGKIETEDDFEWGSDGDDIDTSGGGITWTKSVAGTSTAKITTDQAKLGTRSLELYRDGTNNPNALISRVVSDGETAFFYARHDGTGRWNLSWGNGTKRLYPFVHPTFNLGYNNAVGTGIDTGEALSANIWHLIECRDLDWTGGTFDLYLDGNLVVAAAEMWDSVVDSGTIRLRGIAGDAYVFIDNFRILANRTTTAFANGLTTDDPFYSDLSSLAPETKHIYEAQLQNSEGEGLWSSEATFWTIAASRKASFFMMM